MDAMDARHRNFERFLKELPSYDATIFTEQDTRVKVIDRILTEVLGWPLGEVFTEASAGSGFVDYRLTIDGLTRLIIEAKRNGREMGVKHRSPGRPFKLRGPAFRSPAVSEGIEQAVRYCGQKNAELACVTNGKEWIVFRGNRLGDGTDTLDGVAFVFPDLSAVNDSFALFDDLLSYESVRSYVYRAHFQEAEGRPIRATAFSRALRPEDTRHVISSGGLSADLDRVMTSFFRRLSGDEDPDLLVKCFVETRDSKLGDARLVRIAEDLIGRIQDLDTASAAELTHIIERAKTSQRNEFVIIVGTKGAGKSTFIERFFKVVLVRPLRDQCILARINLADSEGSEQSVVSWLDRSLLKALETAIFADQLPEFEDVQGMFYDEYQRMRRGTLRHLYEKDKEAFKIEFGRHIEGRREREPHEYIKRLLGHIVRVRKKVPCLVFDNADHFTIEFQERVFQYARSIYEGEVCLVILPITDRTSWQLSREGALRSFETESLLLPTPSPKRILEKRIEFLEAKLGDEKREPGRGYFIGRGIGLTLDNLTGFAAVLQTTFLRTGSVASWVGNLANNDIRRCLELARNTIASPHLDVEELLKSYIAKSSVAVPRYKVRRALIRGKYDIFPGETHTFVWNVYALDAEFETSPLLGIRILQTLRDMQKSDPHDPFVTVRQLFDYLRAMLIEPAVTAAWLSRMLDAGLCFSYDPTVTSITKARKVELTPSGYQHLRWGTREPDYIQAMLEVTPIRDEAAFQRLNGLAQQSRQDVWWQELRCFLSYLISEDKRYCATPDHAAYVSQGRLTEDFEELSASVGMTEGAFSDGPGPTS